MDKIFLRKLSHGYRGNDEFFEQIGGCSKPIAAPYFFYNIAVFI